MWQQSWSVARNMQAWRKPGICCWIALFTPSLSACLNFILATYFVKSILNPLSSGTTLPYKLFYFVGFFHIFFFFISYLQPHSQCITLGVVWSNAFTLHQLDFHYRFVQNSRDIFEMSKEHSCEMAAFSWVMWCHNKLVSSSCIM